MPAVSKHLFYEKVGNEVRCCDALHPWTTNCFKVLAYSSTQFVIGTGKFYAALYMVQFILKIKKTDRKLAKRILLSYLRSTAYGTALAIIIMSSICFMSKLLGRLHYYVLGLFGGVLSGYSIFIESKENRIINSLFFANLCLDALVRYLEAENLLTRTRSGELLVFMLLSSILMYLNENSAKKSKLIHLWYYLPSKELDSNNTQKCGHPVCSRYILEAFTNYFTVGFCINLIKKLVPRFSRIIAKPRLLFEVLTAKDNFLFGLFLSTHVGIYRAVTCLFKQNDVKGKEMHAIVAGFLSGAAYALKPSLQTIFLAFVTVIQLLYLKVTSIFPSQKRIPFSEIVFMISNGILLHTRLTNPGLCPKYYINTLDVATNGLFNKMYENFAKIIFPA